METAIRKLDVRPRGDLMPPGIRKKRAYELRVLPLDAQAYGLALFEATGVSGNDADRLRPIVRIWKTPLQAILDRVIAAVRTTGGRASDLRRGRSEPFVLDEETGVRLGLLFMAVKPLRKLARIEAVSHATAAMSPEEAYYWFSKCSDRLTSRRGQRALRILTAGG